MYSFSVLLLYCDDTERQRQNSNSVNIRTKERASPRSGRVTTAQRGSAAAQCGNGFALPLNLSQITRGYASDA
jgi:hypothetical protein